MQKLSDKSLKETVSEFDSHSDRMKCFLHSGDWVRALNSATPNTLFQKKESGERCILTLDFLVYSFLYLSCCLRDTEEKAYKEKLNDVDASLSQT